MEETNLSLNIVAVPVESKTQTQKKKKIKNKYDKRRAKGVALKRQKELQNASGKKKVVDEVDSSKETVEEPSDTATTTSVPSSLPSDSIQSAFEHLPPSIIESTTPSILPDDAEQRAAYLAEFHARPYELDRRAEARTKVKPLRSSRHLWDSSAMEWSRWLHPRIASVLTGALQLSQPTRIQGVALELLLSKENHANSWVHSETGSGKTLAFVLPLLQHLLVPKDRSSNGTQLLCQPRPAATTFMLIVVPTKEVARQTHALLQSILPKLVSWLVPGLLGDDARSSEKARLRKGLGVVVTTPGRLLDHLQHTEAFTTSLQKLQYLVLDEADRLVEDSGFQRIVERLVEQLNKTMSSYQTLLVSATASPNVEVLAQTVLGNSTKKWSHIRVERKPKSNESAIANDANSNDNKETSNLQQEFSTPRQLRHLSLTCSVKFRLAALACLVLQRIKRKQRTVVFFATCAAVDYYSALFRTVLWGEKAKDSPEGHQLLQALRSLTENAQLLALHGQIPQARRIATWNQFTSNTSSTDASSKTCILFATDVAARGVNLQNVLSAIQFDPPANVADYSHRAGRVARAGQAGESILLVVPSERGLLEVLNSQKNGTTLTAVSLADVLATAAGYCEGEKKKIKEKQEGDAATATSTKSDSLPTIPIPTNKSRRGEEFGLELQKIFESAVAMDDACIKAHIKEAKKKAKSLQKQQRKKRRVGVAVPAEPEVEVAVHKSNSLSVLAKTAYLAHVRAYPTREPQLKPFFAAKALHLGHVAKSFALRDPPKHMAAGNQQQQAGHQKKKVNGLSLEEDSGPKKRKVEVNDPVSNKKLLLSNASKLLTAGMDSI